MAHDSDLRDPLFVQRPGVMRAGDFFGAVVFEYAEAPLVQAISGDAGIVAESPIVDDLVGGQISIGGAFHERLRMDLLAPVYFTSLGPDGREGPTMGDVRVSTLVNLLAPEDVQSGAGGFGIGLVGHLDLPSGDADRFLGRGTAAGGGRVAATWEFPVATITADAGVEGSPAIDLGNLQGGPYATGGLGLGLLVRDKAGVTLEGIARTPLARSSVEGTGLQAEAVLSIRGRSRKGVGWMLGGAGGLTEGAGVPTFRAFFGLGFGHHEPPKISDVDTEGLLAVRDGCPLQLETVNGWKDEDGCPDQLGAMSVDIRFAGRSWPATVDLTGPAGTETVQVGAEGLVRDAVPGSQWSATATTDDCLVGQGAAEAKEGGTALVVELQRVFDAPVRVSVLTPEGEPVPEAVAVWRSEERAHCVPEGVHQVVDGSLLQDVGPGDHILGITAEGYSSEETQVYAESGKVKDVIILLKPTRIRVEAKRIVILEKVFFQTGKAEIKPESFSLLDEVGTTILTNPQIGRVEIGGHTDNQGSESYNQRLSQQRAEAVRTYLIAKGVPGTRLVAAGYGETRPIDTNRTPAGRERNRRVEFNLVDAPEETP
ncbi:MAG: OmpA family protein [Myxococcota bacterium]